jgi:hypothetical protein
MYAKKFQGNIVIESVNLMLFVNTCTIHYCTEIAQNIAIYTTVYFASIINFGD